MAKNQDETVQNNPPTLYFRFKKSVVLTAGHTIMLSDIARFLIEEPWNKKLSNLRIVEKDEIDGSQVVVDILLIVHKVKALIPDVEIELYGDPQTLVQIKQHKPQRKVFQLVAFIVVWILLFFGSGMAIINFHEDVGMEQVQKKIATMLTGKEIEHPYFMQIPYSIGIGLGMVVFFNHFTRKKINEDPNPLEVEIYLYDEDLTKYTSDEQLKVQDQ